MKLSYLVLIASVIATPVAAQDAIAFLQSQSQSQISGKQNVAYTTNRNRIVKPHVGARSERSSSLPPPPAFVRGRLVCAINVNRYRAKLGLATTGSAAAKSFLGLRRTSRHQIGAVQVERRKGGGHAKIVAGGGLCWNPSASRQAWHLTACGSRNVIGWVT